mmetsp:Transcript_28828/g.73877  ORF Transcript_28828/g.73877 Transcript_28828/m.73877 type:complete len:112 (-) Transcript_28828:36-371(-)
MAGISRISWLRVERRGVNKATDLRGLLLLLEEEHKKKRKSLGWIMSFHLSLLPAPSLNVEEEEGLQLARFCSQLCTFVFIIPRSHLSLSGVVCEIVCECECNRVPLLTLFV